MSYDALNASFSIVIYKWSTSLLLPDHRVTNTDMKLMILSLSFRKRTDSYSSRLSVFEEDFFDFSDSSVLWSLFTIYLFIVNSARIFQASMNFSILT